jgi:hypothetical protein
MRSLRELQSGFASALFSPGATSSAPGIRADGISPVVRLGFYRANVTENYRKALSATFPAVERLVGSGFLGCLAQEYIRRHASHSGDVGRFCECFPEFLRRHTCARELPYLADVARLEWCIEESFNETDPEPLDLERLAAVPEHQCEHLRFLLAPSCRLLSSAFPVDRIWEVCQLHSDDECHVDLDVGGAELLVRRDRWEVAVESQRSSEFAMLTALAAGATFGGACRRALGVDEAFDPGEFLQHHVATGVLADFTLPAEVHGL